MDRIRDDGSALEIARAAASIREADGLLITAGAGMGVDSGLPDFRGKEGFWRAYPALAKTRIGFSDVACPEMFVEKPRLAWGFYGHRLNLYRRTVPHEGFQILRRWAQSKPHGAFVYTSNVDGQFQKAGFPENRIDEVHGSIHHLQCLDGCWGEIWPADEFTPVVDEEQCLLTSDLPRCPHCGGVARPAILMFGDWGWLEFRERIQAAALKQWLAKVKKLVVVEIGAGTDIPTVRRFGEGVAGTLVRINPVDAAVVAERGVGLTMRGQAALLAIDTAME